VDQLQRRELVPDHAAQHVIERLHRAQRLHQRPERVRDLHGVGRRRREDALLPRGDDALDEVGVL
jgi:hypothetical protein